jgi:hypothetical protein
MAQVQVQEQVQVQVVKPQLGLHPLLHLTPHTAC